MDVENGTDLRARLFQVLRALVGEAELPAVAENGLGAVLDALQATTGAVYLLDEETLILRRIAARNLTPGSPVDVPVGEGLVGEVAREAQTRRLALPEDPVFVTRTFVGDVRPRELIACPLKRPGGGVAGVLALASPRELPRDAVEALELVGPHFANALLEALALRERDRAATYYGRILSDVDAALIATDREGRVTIWNPAAARLWGLPTERALGRPVRDLGLARDLEPLRDALRDVFTARRATTLDGVAVDRPGGGVRLVRLRISPLTDEAGHLAGAILHGTDVTEERKRIDELGRQKQAVESLNAALRRQARALAERQRELEEKNVLVAAANRARSDFIANVSHELRTPLNSIRGFCRILLDASRNVDESERREFLEIIDRNGRELLSLIDDILDLTKAEAGRLQLEPQELEVGGLARDVIEELSPLAQERGIGLELDVEEAVRPIVSDEAKLRRIIRNLVANAIKFTHEGGVVVHVRKGERGALRLDVVDTGIGIAARDQERIFEPFEQVDGSNARLYGGTGLGLSIVKRLAGALGGGVSIQSAPGLGSTFSVDLPSCCPEPDDHGTAEQPSTAPAPSAFDLPVVLVATVEPRAFDELEPALADEGLAAAWARDGREAVARARELARDGRLVAVVLESDLSVVDGYEALGTLKAEAFTAHVPVFLVASGRAERAGVVLGATEVVGRPYRPEQLARRIALAVRESLATAHLAPARRQRGAGAPAPGPSATPPQPVVVERGRAAREPESARPSSPIVATERAAPTPERPARAPAPAPTAILRLDAPPSRGGRASLEGKSILVVEDNEDSARLAKLILEQRGVHVTLAADAGQALAEIRRAEPDAVIMDLMLPGMDGYEATRAIRQMPERGHVPVVAATAAVLPGDRARALEAGCDDIVAKPYDVEELVARVAAAIEARAARKQPVEEEARAAHGGEA